jgi:hypothetical protein
MRRQGPAALRPLEVGVYVARQKLNSRTSSPYKPQHPSGTLFDILAMAFLTVKRSGEPF